MMGHITHSSALVSDLLFSRFRDTIFWATKKKELCRVAPEEGKMLLHAHGQRCLMHAGDEVKKGSKYMVRADVMYGPEKREEAAVMEDSYRQRRPDYTV